MGQYYMPILGNVYGGQCKVFDRSVNHEYTMAKLLEHSWWNNTFVNTFVNAFSEFLYNNLGRVCWVGDYATEPDDFKLNVPASIPRPNYKKVWGKNVNLLTCAPSAFKLDGKFLVNFDTRQFLDLDEYKANSVGSGYNKKSRNRNRGKRFKKFLIGNNELDFIRNKIFVSDVLRSFMQQIFAKITVMS